MPTLYEIDSAITSCLDTETGEIIDENRLNELLIERDFKLEGVALWVKNLESDAEAIGNEIDALKKRQKTAQNKAVSLRRWLSNAMTAAVFETPRVRISFRKSTVTTIDESLLPKKWCTKKVIISPDKEAIKAALKAGQKIRGACLTENQNIQIK